MKVFAKLTDCYFFEYRAEKFRLAVRKKSAGLASCFLLLIGNKLKKIFSEKFSHLLWTFFGSFPVIEQEKFGRSLKTAFSVSIKAFWEKETVLQNKWNFSSFSDLEQNIFCFLSGFSTGMLELHSTCPKWHFKGEQFYFQFFFVFWTLSNFFDQFSQKK